MSKTSFWNKKNWQITVYSMLHKKKKPNFVTKPQHTKYDQELFLARKQMADHGFFHALIKTITQFIDDKLPSNQNQLALLDTGCGEGSHLYLMKQNLQQLNNNTEVIAAG